MGKKVKGNPPDAEQSRILQRAGFNPQFCIVIRDFMRSMIILDQEHGKVEMVHK